MHVENTQRMTAHPCRREVVARRKYNIWKLAKAVCGYLIMASLLKWPEIAASAVKDALEQWYETIVPALLPFIMLMPIITCREALGIYERMLGGAMGIVAGLPGKATPAVVAAMVAGSPAGAIAAARVAEETGLEKKQLIRIAGCLCGLSPAFLVSGIGAGLMNDRIFGTLLLKTQILTQMIMLITSRSCTCSESESDTINVYESQENGQAMVSLLNVAGYMGFFAMLSALISKVVRSDIGKYIICILEISGGTGIVAESGLSVAIKKVLIAGMCGFGGISICVQNMKILKRYGIGMREYLPWRIVSALLSMAIMSMYLGVRAPSGVFNTENWLVVSSFSAVILIFPAIKGLRKTIT